MLRLLQALACFRVSSAFDRFAKREGIVESDPSSNIESPKLGRKLPSTLTENEIGLLLHAPDLSISIG